MTKRILLILFLAATLRSQTFSNLSYINSFVDSSIGILSPYFEKQDSLFLNYESEVGETYFLNRIQTLLSKNDIKLVFEREKAGLFLDYKINNAGVKYREVIKEGFLEDYFVERELNYSGSFSLQGRGENIEDKNFSFALVDTIAYMDVQKVENSQYEFTKGTIPEEPFWGSILEPAIAVGAIILTVILLFTVRSN